MKIAVISDIHENMYNLVSFYKEIENENIEQIFCLGDLINKGITQILAFSGIPVKMVWGNNDGDKVAITKISLSEKSRLEVSSTVFDKIEIDGKKIFLSHYPMLAKPMAKSGEFDIVFYGHNHIFENTKIGNCLVVNPGELVSARTGIATYAIYDTNKNLVEIKKLKDFQCMKSDIVNEYREKTGSSFLKDKSHYN